MKYLTYTACLLLIISISAGSTHAAESPATAPASTAPSYHAAIIPPGFHAVIANGHTVFCRPTDDAWVQGALSALKPTTRPTTMPSDLAASIAQHRGEVIQEMKQDLAITNTKGIDNLFDTHVLPIFSRLEKLKPSAFFFVVSRTDLATLMDNGWTDPRYHYLRFARDVAYDPEVILSIDKRVDDLVIWVETHNQDSSEAKRVQLIHEIEDFDLGFDQSVSDLCQDGLGNEFDEYIRDHVTTPLKFPQSLEWFGHGVAAVYAIKYKTLLTGGSRTAEITAMSFGDPRNPLHAQPLNLVDPLDMTIMQKQFVLVYKEALFHKAVSVVNAWVTRGGDDVFAKTLPALRAKPPTTSADLINLVMQTTGIDLTPAMLPNYKNTLPQL